jgi:hypothetical protein
MSIFNFKKKLNHFKENCPIEARNYFKEILIKLDSIEQKIDKIENTNS